MKMLRQAPTSKHSPKRNALQLLDIGHPSPKLIQKSKNCTQNETIQHTKSANELVKQINATRAMSNSEKTTNTSHAIIADLIMEYTIPAKRLILQ